jgi:metal-responsive CopG/Arc/MetJ family transcriptional regulator
MNKKEFIGFRLESELLSEIEKQAKKEGRSKSNLIQIALKEYLNKKK